MNLIMKINLILKANVEWHCNGNGKLKRINILSQLATLLSIVASVLTILCN